MLQAALNELSGVIDQFSNGEGIHDCAIAPMHLIRMSVPGIKMPTLYKPSVCFIVQGEKEVLLESEIYTYSPSQYLAISVDLPVIGQVTQASASKPYLCLQLDLDRTQLSELTTSLPISSEDNTKAQRGLFVGEVDSALLDAVVRLARLLHTPQDIQALTPLLLREIYYRLLKGPHGSSLMQLAMPGSNTQRIASVIHLLQRDFTKAIGVEAMAEMAHMSPSSFHQHFKDVTAMSPLQYQKRLRLLEARRLMLSESSTATQAAYNVGYESNSQFSREYARLFGAPPATDIEQLRAVR